MEFINKIFRGDRVIWMIFMFLCLISIVEVYSASSTLTFKTDYWRPIMRHIMILLLGLGIVLLVHSWKPKLFRLLIIALPFSWFLLIGAKFFGTSINGGYRYFLGFQPSEVAKLCLIGVTAFALSKYNHSKNDNAYKAILITSAITCVIIMLDNFSTAFLLFGVIFIMMFIGQIPLTKLLKLTGFCIAAGALLVTVIVVIPENTMTKILPRGNTWKARIDRFTNSDDVTDGTYVVNDNNYQVAQAKIAIARGGLFGKMPGNGRQRDFLPQAYSDFIFAIIVEEMGLLIGGIGVLALYLFLFIRAGIIASRCEKLFPKYLVIGCALMLVTQALTNMAVAVDLIPVTGQPLPLVSRGGTSTLITCVFFGIILSVSRYENSKEIQRDEEIALELEKEKNGDEFEQYDKRPVR
jgi:cell division protein FtsW